MSGFYIWAMRRASQILFAIAILSALTGILPMLMVFKNSARDIYGPTTDSMLDTIVFNSAVGGLSGAVWPFLGAALLWRLDGNRAFKSEAAE